MTQILLLDQPPESPTIELIENSDAIACQEINTSGTPKESTAEAEKTSPYVAAKGGDTAAFARSGSGEAGGLGKSTIRVVLFQSLPESAQEELGKELFDDPLLTVENLQKLADYMQWSLNSLR